MRAQFKAAKLLKKSKKSGGFQSLGLSPLVYRGVMRLGYKVPTPIQRRALPVALSGKDLCAMARTGTPTVAVGAPPPPVAVGCWLLVVGRCWLLLVLVLVLVSVV